ncbi:hypothetical protein MB84_28755 (plasmid) [Pandoraea oxalativorans]|uniref:Uncharacterized protein n=1 Tax=Pandoraea oxalativorans TaxID=573737 RepID=A0A0G3IC04_9BURK|nr:hypothetical protein MB84_28755 [Pandoraea oxalativorans]
MLVLVLVLVLVFVLAFVLALAGPWPGTAGLPERGLRPRCDRLGLTVERPVSAGLAKDRSRAALTHACGTDMSARGPCDRLDAIRKRRSTAHSLAVG